jgi:hypothetical protein
MCEIRKTTCIEYQQTLKHEVAYISHNKENKADVFAKNTRIDICIASMFT